MESAMVEENPPGAAREKSVRPARPRAWGSGGAGDGADGGIMLVVVLGNGLLTGRGASLQGGASTRELTFVDGAWRLHHHPADGGGVTVLLVYWQRDREQVRRNSPKREFGGFASG